MESENQVVFFLSNRDFRDEEYSGIKDALDQFDIGGKIAAVEPGECIGVTGLSLTVDYTVDEVNVDQFGGIIFIGGTGSEQFLNDTAVHALAKSFLDSGKVLAAICWAPAMLGIAGLLNGKKATVWDGAKNDLIKGGAHYTAERVTIDGKIITGDGPDASTGLGQAVAKAIVG
jgi:protease I